MTTLTAEQKLRAIGAKFYDRIEWIPKLNDYYTLTRNSLGLELFQIVEENETQFGIKQLWSSATTVTQENPTWFDKADFATGGFGVHRVWIPKWIVES